MAPATAMPDFIPLNAEDASKLFNPISSESSDLFVTMDTPSPPNGNKENESELSQQIRMLIEGATQASKEGGWPGKSDAQHTPPATRMPNKISTEVQDHEMQDATTNGTGNGNGASIEPKVEAQGLPLQVSLIPAELSSPPPVLASQPQFIIFGASEDDLSYIIPKKSLHNLPDMVLRKLATKGDLAGPSIYMRNYDQLESMKRLKEFLDDKRYRPFKPPIPLEQILHDGTIKVWEQSIRSNTALKAVKVTDSTREFFDREVDFYLFASELGYDELRQASLKNLMHGYPRSINSIWMLIERLFMASHRSDRVLRQHIVDLINANRDELTAHKSYTQFMRQFLKIDGPFGEALFDAYVRASDDARRKVLESSGKEPLPRMRQDKPVPKEPAAATLSRKPSISMRATPESKADSGWPADHLRPSDLPKVTEALLQSRIVVARKSGYGTLVRSGVGRDRNRDFQFAAGETMLVNPFEATTSAHNVVVYNSQGEKGDVLADLICAFPAELGVHVRDREWGQLYQQPMANPILTPSATSSGAVHPDREERIYRDDRRRSMSPPRRSRRS